MSSAIVEGGGVGCQARESRGWRCGVGVSGARMRGRGLGCQGPSVGVGAGVPGPSVGVPGLSADGAREWVESRRHSLLGQVLLRALTTLARPHPPHALARRKGLCTPARALLGLNTIPLF